MIHSQQRLTRVVAHRFRWLTSVLVAAGALFALACASSGNAPAAAGTSASSIDPRLDPVDALVAMRVRGLIVNRTSDGGVALQISGPPASMDGDNQPLYLINDSPFHAGPNGELYGINPADIESVRVLRRGEAAIYGLRGANGVILITTKNAGTPKN